MNPSRSADAGASPKRPGHQRNYKILALILSVAIALFAVVVILIEPASPNATVVNSNNKAASTPSVQGLELLLADNVTTLHVGQRLNVKVSLFNALPSVNTVASSNDWIFQGVPVALWPVCDFPTPVQVVVLMGNYTLQELQTVANVTFDFVCNEGYGVGQAIFEPSSSQANLTGTYAVSGADQTLGSFLLSGNFTTSGYWNLLNDSHALNRPILGPQESPPRPPTATAFVPGVYTVAVADQWGQAAILHFVVRA